MTSAKIGAGEANTESHGWSRQKDPGRFAALRSSNPLEPTVVRTSCRSLQVISPSEGFHLVEGLRRWREFSLFAQSGIEVANSYNFQAPSSDDCLAALLRVFDDQEARQLWRRACQLARVNGEGKHDPATLLKVVEGLEREGGLAAVVACSLSIRLNTYVAVSKAEAGQ